jgi:hypothetical protein
MIDLRSDTVIEPSVAANPLKETNIRFEVESWSPKPFFKPQTRL